MKKQHIIEPAYLKDDFLSNYLFADVLFSQYCTSNEMKAIFDKYASVFYIYDEEWLEDIWSIVSSDLFSLASNGTNFYRLVRLAKHFPENISPMEEYVLSQKARAIKIKSDILGNSEASFDALLCTLESKANGGDTDCIALFAFLEINGIFVRKNSKRAEKRLWVAATWNNLFAILMGCHYAKSPNCYYQKLCAKLSTTSGEAAWQYLKDAMKISSSVTTDEIGQALERTFSRGILSSCRVDHTVMKLIRSSVLDDVAKATLIKKGKDALPSQIPLNVTKNSELKFDSSALSKASDARQAELEQIYSNLSMIDLRDTSVYKPLLLVCEDELVLDYYKEAIKKSFFEAPVVHVSLREDDKYSLCHSNANVFITSMEKHGEKNVVMLLDNCEALNAEACEELSKLLCATNRKHYKADGNQSIELDLSGVLPILFASSVPPSSITERCDVVLAKELTQAEFHGVLEQSLEGRRKIFKLSSLSIDSGVSDFLFDYSSSTVANLLNKTIGMLRCSTQNVHITVETLQSVIDKFYSSKSKNDFWRNSAI